MKGKILSMDPDRKQYEKFLAGDEEAFRHLLEKYQDQLILFIYTYVDNFHTAEDLMEDCFVDLLVQRPKFKGESSFKTYLFQIAKFKAYRQLKNQKRFLLLTTDESEADLAEEATALDDLVQGQENQALHQAISELPQNYRQAIQLFYFEDMTYEEIGKIMGKSKKQIDNYLYRAKSTLKEKFRKEV